MPLPRAERAVSIERRTNIDGGSNLQVKSNFKKVRNLYQFLGNVSCEGHVKKQPKLCIFPEIPLTTSECWKQSVFVFLKK